MKLAVIGAGNVGGAFSRAAVAAGHSVVLTSGASGNAQRVAAEIGATAAASNAQAVDGADLVLLAVPGSAVPAVAAELRDSISGAIVVDATNPLNATYTDLVMSGASAAADLQVLIPDARVVKAFNTVLASRYADPVEGGHALPVLIAGDDAAARASVAELARSLGFQSLEAGGLRFARSLEEMAFLNITLNAANGWAWRSAWTLVGPTSLS